jgi:hypothetical protein
MFMLVGTLICGSELNLGTVMGALMGYSNPRRHTRDVVAKQQQIVKSILSMGIQ